MTNSFDPDLVDVFLAHHWRYRPVDATFMGEGGHDHLLPPAGDTTLQDEIAEIEALLAQLEATEEPADLGERLDRRLMISELKVKRAAATERPRLHNPAWYTGEAAFSVISLLLPQSLPVKEDALLARLRAIPGFLADGSERLDERPVPKGWLARAQREAEAVADFLRNDLKLHEAYQESWQGAADEAAEAFEEFASVTEDLPDADPASGEAYLTLLLKEQHGLDMTPADAIAMAQAAYDRLGQELEVMARAIDPAISWQDQIAALGEKHPDSPEAAMDLYFSLDVEAVATGAALVTPAQEYDLEYRWLSPCFRKVAKSLYFLFYRSPPALDPGEGSVYWVFPPGEDEEAFLKANSVATVKTIHAVHHGSVGHHTQNTRARAAQSRLARLAGTDCALGLAFLGSITLIEGWACYVEDLLMEAPGFYEPAEILLLKSYERRNAASVLVDAKLHTGEWSALQAASFYKSAGFAPARVEGEIVRNSMMPSSRMVYWLGVEGIKALRRRWTGEVADFHDQLLSYGHMPLSWIGQEMERAGLLN